MAFKDLVKDKWMSYTIQGNGISKLKDKLKMLKADLKVWNYEVFRNLNSNKERILKELEDLDFQNANGGLKGSSRSKRIELIGMLAVINKRIDSLVSQKVKQTGLSMGTPVQGTSTLHLDGEHLEMKLNVLWSEAMDRGTRGCSERGEKVV